MLVNKKALLNLANVTFVKHCLLCLRQEAFQPRLEYPIYY